MEIKQCDFCRAPFQTLGSKICGDCHTKIDEDFIKIREYLYDHDRANVEEVAEATGVSRKSIMYLLKEERLLVGEDDGAGSILKCEICKKPINTGRMCVACKKEVFSAMQESIGATAPPRRIKKEPEEDSGVGVAKLQLK